MMRFLRGTLPNLCIALNIALLIVIYLDLRNPMMGFLSGAPFLSLVGVNAVVSVATAVVLYADWRTPKKADTDKRSEKNKKVSIDT